MVKSKSRSTGSAEARAMGVLHEQMQSQMQVVVEGVHSMHGELRSLGVKVDALLEERLGERISALEQVVRQNSLDIRRNSEDIRKNSEDIARMSSQLAALQSEVASLRHDFDTRHDRSEVQALERRVSAIEARLEQASIDSHERAFNLGRGALTTSA
jgi:hypothetical protein